MDHPTKAPANHTSTQRTSFARLLSKLFVTSAIFWIPTIIFLLLVDEIRGNRPLFGEDAVLRDLHAASNQTLDRIVVFITDLGSAQVVVVGVVLAAAILAYSGRKRLALFLLTCAAGTAAINVVLKHLFQRDRPALWTQIVTEHGFSFPSGHAMISSALAFSVIIMTWKTKYRWYIAFISVAYFLLVGISRLYLGVHYPTDVIAGWCVSLLWVATVHRTFEVYGRRRSAKKPIVE